MGLGATTTAYILTGGVIGFVLLLLFAMAAVSIWRS